VRAFESLDFGNPADAAVNLLLSMFAHGAGVVQDHVRLFPVIGKAIAKPQKLALDELGVEDVHLATKGLQVNMAGIVVILVHGGDIQIRPNWAELRMIP
jgi:hypothetical protein